MGQAITSQSSAPGKRWAILGVVYFGAVVFAMVTYAVPPSLPLMIKELHLSYTQAGLLMSLFALPGIVISIPVGMLSDRYGARLLYAGAFLGMALGTALVALGESFLPLGIGRLVAGIAGRITQVLALQIVAQWFMRREMGTAMGIFSTAVPLGAVLAFNSLGALAYSAGWRPSIWLTVLLSVVALVAFLAIYSPPPQASPARERSTPNILAQVREAGRPIWLVGLSWLWFNAAFVAFLSFAPAYFISRRFSPAFANLLGSFDMVGSLVISPGVGYVMDRTGRKEFFIVAGGLATSGILLAVFWLPAWALPVMIAMGIASALPAPPIYALVSDVLKPERLGLGYGILSTCLNIGSVLGPYLVGLSRDMTGSYQTGFYIMALFAFLVAVTPLCVRWLGRHGQPYPSS